MENTFQLDIVASDHPFFSGECEMLVFRSSDGERIDRKAWGAFPDMTPAPEPEPNEEVEEQ